jgi:phosphoribosylanthranilate isomerase
MIAKICGITRRADALHAAEQGATALGFVFWPESPRYIAPDRAAEIVAALPGGVAAVGVFVNQSIDDIREIARKARITTIQLHGDEPADYATSLTWPVWRAISLGRTNGTLTTWPAPTVFLLDAHDPVRRGGTGRMLDWPAAAALAAQHPIVLAGGLTPDNVGAAIRTVRPVGVDVSSGVESAPGIKDHARITSFLEHVRAAFNDD